jgi:lysophospholipase
VAEPAPLLFVAGSAAPPGGTAEWVTGADGVRLRAALFPATAPRGSVVLSPGRTEPIEKYYEVVDELRGRGFTVLVHDWRGHGLSARLTSDPLKGHGAGWRSYVSDYRAVLEAFAGRLPRPWLAMGHSMGGGLTALALVEGEARFAGAVLTAPMMGLDLTGKPARLARGLAWLLSRLGAEALYAAGPGDPLYGPFEGNLLTHDRTRWDRTVALVTEQAGLRLGGPTWGWLELAFQIGKQLSQARLTIPLLVVAAEEERLVANAASKAFAERSGGRWVLVEGARHEILMETDDRRRVFWDAFDRFVGKVVTPPPA